MPYTLMKGLGWILIALVLGIVIGWFMRSVAAKRQVERARAHHVDTVEMERLRGRIANLEPVVAERDRLLAELEAQRAPPGVASGAPGAEPAGPAHSVPGAPDVAAATAVLGHAIALDDLKVVDGVGPKIESLCHGIGIRTWFDLSTTEVSLLRTMLADAGPRLRAHDPTTWPQQARLLAEGRWAEFKSLNAGEPTGPTAAPPPD
jgi:predicted flap endonuclease-1-like 5' DNA nuclease